MPKGRKTRKQKERSSKRRQRMARAEPRDQAADSKKAVPSRKGFFVKTAAGNAVYPSNTLVYSRLGEGGYIAKQVGDLKEGESLAWRMDSIDASLEDVEPHLPKSPRYALARSNLFQEINGTEQKVFRVRLLESARDMGLISDEALEDILTGRDGHSSEIAVAARKFHEEYASFYDHFEEVPRRASGTVLGWLRGEAVSPSEHGVFLGLGMASGSKLFGDWYRRAENDAKNDSYDVSSFYGSYKIWSIMRQQIMSYLNRKGSKNPGQKGSEGGSKEGPVVGIRPEIDLIVSEFIDQIDEEMLSAKILEIRPLEAGAGKGKKSQKPEHSLSRGAYTGLPKEGMNMRSPVDALTDFDIVKEAYRGIITEWVSEAAGSSDPEDSGVRDFARFVNEDEFLGNYGERAYGFLSDLVLTGSSYGDHIKSSLHRFPRSEEDDILEMFVGLMLKESASGRIDARLGLGDSLTYRLVSAAREIYNAVPEVFKSYNTNLNSEKGAVIYDKILPEGREKSLNRSRLYDIRRDRRVFERKIEGEHDTGLESLVKRPRMLTSLVHEISPSGVLVSQVSTDEDFRASVYENPFPEGSYIKRDRAAEAMSSYGLEDAFRFIDRKNFALEDPVSA